MYTIVGLGNPGEEYSLSRHNVGRVVLIKALEKENISIEELKGGRLGQLVKGTISEKQVQVLFPETYMNDSGKSVSRYVDQSEVNNLIVVYDDVDLPIGDFKVSFGRGDGGHNGLASIISSLGSKDFIRIRIGISQKNFFGKTVRPKGDRLATYVLGRMSKQEISKLEEVGERVGEVIRLILSQGLDKAMNKFN